MVGRYSDDPELRRTGTGDLPLFDAPVPYQRSSDTSRAAAEHLEREVSRVRQLVWLAYQRAGAQGLSADMAAEATRPEGYDAGEWKLVVRPRASEMLRDGLLERTTRTVRNDSGQRARVLVARTLGRS